MSMKTNRMAIFILLLAYTVDARGKRLVRRKVPGVNLSSQRDALHTESFNQTLHDVQELEEQEEIEYHVENPKAGQTQVECVRFMRAIGLKLSVLDRIQKKTDDLEGKIGKMELRLFTKIENSSNQVRNQLLKILEAPENEGIDGLAESIRRVEEKCNSITGKLEYFQNSILDKFQQGNGEHGKSLLQLIKSTEILKRCIDEKTLKVDENARLLRRDLASLINLVRNSSTRDKLLENQIALLSELMQKVNFGLNKQGNADERVVISLNRSFSQLTAKIDKVTDLSESMITVLDEIKSSEGRETGATLIAAQTNGICCNRVRGNLNHLIQLITKYFEQYAAQIRRQQQQITRVSRTVQVSQAQLHELVVNTINPSSAGGRTRGQLASTSREPFLPIQDEDFRK